MPLFGKQVVWADSQYDGSDSGARPDEAVSWGKIRAGAESVKVSRWSRLHTYNY